MTVLFGIKNCDTVKKARSWLDERGIEYRFHDFRADGLTLKQVQEWIRRAGVDTLVNTRSSTWKQLPASQQEQVLANNAAAIILTHPTLIKRPLLETDDQVLLIGFRVEEYEALFPRSQ